MLLLGEQDLAGNGHDSLNANSLVMVTLRQAASIPAPRVDCTELLIPLDCFEKLRIRIGGFVPGEPISNNPLIADR